MRAAIVDVRAYTATYAWTGTPTASTSTETIGGTLTRTNAVHDPAATGNPAAWESNAAFDRSVVPGWGEHPSAIRVERVTAAAARLSFYATMTPSTEYTVRFHVRSSEDTTVQVNYRAQAVNSTQGSVTLGSLVVPEGESIVEMTGVTSPTGWTPSGAVVLISPSGPLGRTLDVTGLQVEQGATVGDYFDGDTAPRIILNS